MNWKTGDTVKLKSGGPVMTVDGAAGERVTCYWFADKQPQNAQFKPAMLEAAQPPRGGMM